MKSQRRFLVVLLALALAVSCFAVFAFAEGESYDHLDMLEFYEAGYYLNEQFDGDGELFADSGSGFVPSSNGYTCSVSGGKGTFGASVYTNTLTVTPDKNQSFGINIKGKNLAVGRASSIKLQFVKDQANFDVLDVFTLANGTLEYATAAEPVTNAAFNNGTEYTLAFFCDGEYATLEVNGVSYSIEIGSYDYSEIKLIFLAAEFDYIEIYKGSFPRRLADIEDTVAQIILDIKNNDSDNEQAIEAVAKVYGIYGFDSGKITDPDVAAAADAFAIEALSIYGSTVARKLVETADAITATNDYYTVAALVKEMADYVTLLDTIETTFAGDVEIDIDADVFDEKKEILENAEIWLVEQKANTIATIANIGAAPDAFTANYKQLYDFYQVYKLAPICGTYYDAEHPAEYVVECFTKAELLKEEFLRVDAMAKAFSENAPVAADDTLTFGERYVAYAIAKENVFTDETYNEFLDDVTVADLNAMFAEATLALADGADYAKQFISKVEQASKTNSFSVMQSILDEAAAYLEDVEDTFPGVQNAKELYDTLLQRIVDAKAAAIEYIKAVLAIADAQTVKEKREAVAEAKEMAALGNDISLDVNVDGVTVRDANILLSDAESELAREDLKSTNFINAVNEIAKKTDISERRAAIFAATSLLNMADRNIQAVKDAIDALDKAMEAYNAEVDAANAKADESKNAACEVVEQTVITKIAAEVVAIIKKFF